MAKEKTTRERVIAKLSEIKKIVFDDGQEEVKAADVKMVDGTILRIEPALEVGATAEVVSEDGELTAVADGQVELEDGTVITVEGGIIVEVVGVEGEGEEAAPEEMNEEVDTEGATPEQAPAFDLEKLQEQIINKLNVAITEKIDRLKFAKKEQIIELKDENKKLKDTLSGLIELFEEFADTPKEKPKNKGRNPFKKNTDFDFTKLNKLKN